MATIANSSRANVKNNYENLLSIITAIGILLIVGSFFTLAKQYPPRFTLFDKVEKASKVQGYKRPGAKLPQVKNNADKNKTDLLASLPEKDVALLKQRFDQATLLLHADEFEYAIKALTQVIKIQPKLPEAYVNLGFAYLGIKEYRTSAESFSRAIDLRPEQINAYYGLAEALEGMGEYEGALGAMRSYIHLSPPNDPFVAKARAALWVWETKLGRKPQVEQTDQNFQFDSKRFNSPHNSDPRSSSQESSSQITAPQITSPHD